MIRLALFVGIGVFFGSILRFLLSHLLIRIVLGSIPVGMLMVNIAGYLLLGSSFRKIRA